MGHAIVGLLGVLLAIPVWVLAGNGLEIVQTTPTACIDLPGGGGSPVASADGLYLYVNRGTSIQIFARDGGTGALTYLGSFVPNPDFNVGDLALSPDGEHLYALSSLSPTNAPGAFVFILARDPVTGALTNAGQYEDDGSTRLEEAAAVAVSPDGAHVYVTAPYESISMEDAINVFARDPISGALQFVELFPDVFPAPTNQSLALSPDGDHVYVLSTPTFFGSHQVKVLGRDQVTGSLTLLGGANVEYQPIALAVSPDGHSVYAVTPELNPGFLDFLHVFSRDVVSGLLTTVETLTDDVPGQEVLNQLVAVMVSPDDAHVYAATRRGIVTLARDALDGSLTMASVILDSDPGVDGIGNAGEMIVSPDGAYLYSSGEGMASFARDAVTGGLAFIEAFESEIEIRSGVAVTPDGAHVYTLCGRAVKAFERDPVTGLVTLTGSTWLGQRIDGARSIVASHDGAHLYVMSPFDDHLAVLARDAGTGGVTLAAVYEGVSSGIPGSTLTEVVLVSPDDAHVYLLGVESSPDVRSIVVYARDAGSGLLTPVEQLHQGIDGVDGLDGAVDFVMTPDGRFLYVSSMNRFDFSDTSDGIAIFARDETTGTLEFQEVVTVHGPTSADLFGVEELDISPDGSALYAAGRWANGGAIAVYHRDATTGQLAYASVARTGSDGATLPALAPAIRPDGAFLYASRADGGMETFRRDDVTGALAAVERFDVSGAFAVSPDGKHLYVRPEQGGTTTVASRALCTAVPTPGCQAAAASALKIVDKAGQPDVLRWKWNGTGPLAIGDPAVSTDLALCVYDSSPATQPVLSGIAGAGGTCGLAPCWKTIAAGYKYTDKLGTPDGLVKLKVASVPATASLVFKGKGPWLPPLGLPYVAPITVQVQASSGGCWEAEFPLPKLSTDTHLTAKQ